MKARSTMSKFNAVLLLALATIPVFAHGSFGFNLDGSLDKPAISKAYFEGDFSRILLPLETWRTSRANKTREDSIFVYKYLSVIYAAEPISQKKAESYMVQLLKLMPTIELVDMFISDNIEAIFKDVQAKFLSEQKYIREHDHLGRAIQSKDQSKPGQEPAITKGKSSGNAWVWWTAAGVSLVAAAGTTFYLSEPKQETKKTVIPVWQGGNPQ